jgi:adenosylcobinamide-GDP ribazoletransferase
LGFIAALRFLTSIPLPGKGDISPEQLGKASSFFPVAGLIIGGILVLLNWLLGYILPPAVVNALLIGAMVLLTGALHLDGLADTCDGIAGNKTVEERWAVMRDSRTGAFGVVGILIVLLVKYVTLHSIPEDFFIAVLLFMPVVSRWAMVYAIFAFRYARPSGLGTAFKESTRWPQLTIATVITLVIATGLFPLFSLAGFIIIFGVWLVITLLALYLKHKFAGLTGDTYGAINEVAEALALVIALIMFTTASNLT